MQDGRSLVIVPAWPGQLSCSELIRQAEADLRPRTDYVELARALDADVMDIEYMRRRATRTARLIEQRLGVVPAQVAEAFLQRHRFRHIVVRADRLGLPEWVWVVLHQPGDAAVVRAPGRVWDVLHSPGHVPGRDDITFGTGYCLIPWTGVMAAGYGFGALLQLECARRRRLVFLLGVVVTLAFVLLRAWNQYGDPRPWQPQPSPFRTFLSFLNCTKYPASLLYLLMTLGPALLALAICDRPLGPVGRRVVVFGRVPFFFYLLHIPLIHGGAVLCDLVRFRWSPLAHNGPWFRPEDIPPDYGVGLPTVYLVWVGVVLALYWPCRWYAELKRRHPGGVLSYL
jgi:hypothetical protein